MILKTNLAPGAGRRGNAGRPVPRRWKDGGAAFPFVSLLVLVGTWSQGNLAAALGPKVDPIIKEGGGTGPVDSGDVRTPEARLHVPWTDRGTDVSLDEHYEVEAGGDVSGSSTLEMILNSFAEKAIHPDAKPGEDAGLVGDDRGAKIKMSIGTKADLKEAEETDNNKKGDNKSNKSNDKPNDATGQMHLKASTPATLGSLGTGIYWGGNTKNLASIAESPSGRLSAARDIAKSALANILAIKKSFEDGDTEAFRSVIKSVLDDVEPLIGAGESMGIVPPTLDIDASDKTSILKGMSSTEFIEYLRSHARTYDILEEHANLMINALEGLDLTLFSPSETSNKNEFSDHVEFEVSPGVNEDKFDSFEFDREAPARSWHSQHQNPSETLGQYHPTNMLHDRSFHDAFSAHPTSRHLDKLGLFSNEDVDARHELRRNALGDSCPANCALTNTTCNCEKLFDCVSKMSAYDLANLLSSGYIVSDQNSDKYGKFTVERVVDLKLFNAENGQGLGHMLEEIKTKVSGGPSLTNCRDVLQQFHFPCNPSKEKMSCSTPNSQSFQATVDQVCDAVNTPTKLLFEAIGAEFDSFRELTLLTGCYPTSYTTCGEFVQVFDRLYEARDTNTYPLANPMRKHPTSALYNMDVKEVFEHVDLPSKYYLSKDEYGVSDGFETFVSLMHNSVKVMSVGACNEDSNLMLMDEGSGGLSARFFLVAGKLISARCPSFALNANDCSESAKISLKEEGSMEWRFENDQIESIDCPGKIITTSDNNQFKLMPANAAAMASNKWTMAQMIPPRIISQISSNKVITVEGSCPNNPQLSMKDRVPGDISQQFYFNDDGSIESALCPSVGIAIAISGGVQVTASAASSWYPKGRECSFKMSDWEAYFGQMYHGSYSGNPLQVKNVEQWRNGELIYSGSLLVWPKLGLNPPRGRRYPNHQGDDFRDGDLLIHANGGCDHPHWYHEYFWAMEQFSHVTPLALYTIPNPIQNHFRWTVKDSGHIKTGCPSKDYFVGSNPSTGLPNLKHDFLWLNNVLYTTWSWSNLDEVFTLTNMIAKKAITVPFSSISGCAQQDPILIMQNVSGEKNQQFRFKNGLITSELCPNKKMAIKGACYSQTPKILLTDGDEDCKFCKWKFGDDGMIENVGCSNEPLSRYGLSTHGHDLHLGQLFRLDGDPRWRLDKANYETSFVPDFEGHPTKNLIDGCVARVIDKRLASKAMSSCDQAMGLLAGGRMSLGTLKAIVNSVEGEGPGKMPGVCCLDNALNSQHFGHNYEPATMECQNPGPWHLGLAEETCKAAGGKWTRTPCSTLKGCIDRRPKRFNLETTSTLDQIKKSVNFGYVVAQMNDADFVEEFGSGSHTYHSYDTSWGEGLCRQSGKSYDSIAGYSADGCASFCWQYKDTASYRGFSSKKVHNGKHDCRCLFDDGASGVTITYQGDGASGKPDGASGTAGWTCHPRAIHINMHGNLGEGLCRQGGKSYDCVSVQTSLTLDCTEFCSKYKDESSYRGYSLKEMDDGKQDCRCHFDDGAAPSGVTIDNQGQGASGKADGASGLVGWECHPWLGYPKACFDFCSSLEGYNSQIGMMVEEISDNYACVCLYQNGMAPKRDPSRNYATRNPPTFYLTNPDYGLALGLPPGSKCSDFMSLEAQKHIDGTLGQEFQFTYDGRLINLACPKYAFTAASSGELRAMEPDMLEHAEVSDPQTQQWTYANGVMKNVKYTDLMISAAKGDSSFNSYYFALVNPSTGLAIGVSGDCADGPDLVLQVFEDGSPRQNFKFDGTSLVSMMCPNLAIGYIGDGCSGAQVTLVDLPGANWILSEKGNILSSPDCDDHEDKIIEIDGTGSDSGRVKFAHFDVMSSPPATYPSMSNSVTPRTVGNFTNTKVPEPGTMIVLSNLGTATKYQQWTKKTQRFQDLLGPFHFINYGKAIGAGRGGCHHGMKLKSRAYDPHEPGQKFYIGNHGTMFSKLCYGLAIGIAGGTCSSNQIRLLTYQPANNGMKWKYKENGVLESVMCPNQVIYRSQVDVSLSTPGGYMYVSYKWRRENTRLLSNPLPNDWMNEWTVNYVEEDYKDPLRGSTAASVRFSYASNLAFSPSFEDFAKGLVVKDDTDEELCRAAREGLGYDMDYPYDIDLCQNFQKRLCEGKEFVGIDDLGEKLSQTGEPPKMTIRPAEYEKAEYDPVSYDAPEYDDDPPLPFKEIPEETAWVIAESHEKENKGDLAQLQDAWLGLSSVLAVSDNFYEFKEEKFKDVCDTLPDVLPAPMTCLPNLLKNACKFTALVTNAILFALHFAIVAAENIVFNVFEKATEGPDGEIYANNASRKTYENLKNLDTFTKGSLKAINQNIKNQHTHMRQHLQHRHLALETNLGQGLADAQNALGKGIVDAQNVNARLVVDAQNSINGNLCMIYNVVGGSCGRMIGPLEEGQLIIPFDFHLSEGQSSLSEALHNSLSVTIHEALEAGSVPNMSSNIHRKSGDGIAGILRSEIEGSIEMMKEMSRKVDAVESNGRVIQEVMEEHVGKIQDDYVAMKEKISEIDGKIGEIDGKVEAMMKMMVDMMNMKG